MFFKRIGTKKNKFTVNIYLKRLTITPGDKQYVKVFLIRGDHHCETEKPNKLRKGVCNFNRQKLNFDCTMFYDDDKNAYVEKTAQLKIKQCDKDGQGLKTLAKIEFNLAEYLNMEESFLQIEFEFDKSDAKMEADIEFIRVDQAATQMDDKKSARSQDTTKSAQTDSNKRKKSDLQDIKKQAHARKQLTNIEEMEQSTKQPKQNSQELKASDIKAKKNMIQEKSKQDEKQTIKQNKKSSKIVDQKDNSTKFNEIFQNVSTKRRQQKDVVDRQHKKGANEIMNKKQANLVGDRNNRSKLNGDNGIPPQQYKSNSNEASPFLLRKDIEEKNREIERLKSQNANLLEVIDRLSKQSLPSMKTDLASRYQKLQAENMSLKEKIIQKEIVVGQYEVKLRSSKEREERAQQSLKRISKDYQNVRQQLQHSKNKTAQLLQSCFELGDNNLIAFVQKHLQLE